MADQEDVPEPADPVVMDLVGWAATIGYYICYPIAYILYYTGYYLSYAGLFVLKLVYRPLEFVLLPVIYLIRFIFACLIAPFQFLAKFETIYIFLGIAALVGLTAGLVIGFINGTLQSMLGLDTPGVSRPVGRTAKQYRMEREKQRAKAEAPLISSGPLSPGNGTLSDGMRKGTRGKGLTSQTIMEEMDSDY